MRRVTVAAADHACACSATSIGRVMRRPVGIQFDGVDDARTLGSRYSSDGLEEKSKVSSAQFGGGLEWVPRVEAVPPACDVLERELHLLERLQVGVEIHIERLDQAVVEQSPHGVPKQEVRSRWD